MVRAAPFAASILVLSEDGGHRVVRALTAEVLRWLDPRHRKELVDLEPADEGAQEAVQANLWKGKDKKGGGHRRIVEIARTVATKIMSPTGYVLIHIDADRLWSEQEKNPSENLRRYVEDICLHVERHVDDLLMKQGRTEDKAEVLSRLCLLSPYYSIESWLLQNTVVARNLCRKHHRGRDVGKFDKWEQNRGLLDDVYQPKNATCLGAGRNHELASTGFPSRAVYAAGKSFKESVDRLRACHPLVAALLATHPGY
jgi:hypothetical protein